MDAPLLSASKVRTALKRHVEHVDGNLYHVGGDPKLDDLHDVYEVVWNPKTGRHECSCYDDMVGGRRRRKEGCSHVAAAMLLERRRAGQKDLRRERQLEHEATAMLEQTEVPAPTDPRFTPEGEKPLPDWVQAIRPTQWRAVERIIEHYEAGAKIVMLQAPVGTGKTLTAELARRLIGGRGLYVCSTKTLQDQAARDFSEYARVLKGRANYPTLTGLGLAVNAWGRAVASPDVDGDLTCADCTGENCRWCDPVQECPYRVARDIARRSRLAILNTAYFLADANKGGRKFAGRDLAIMDEADLLEGELLSQVEVKITARRMERLRMSPPDRKTVAESWLPWVQNEAIPRVRARLDQLPGPSSASVRELRERNGLYELLDRLNDLAVELPGGGWIYDGYPVARRGSQGRQPPRASSGREYAHDVIFRPIEVGKWGRQLLWPHAERFLLMSGTIISADQMAKDLGIEDDYEVVDVPMEFPVENRPINVVALAEMVKGGEDKAWPKMVQGIVGVLAEHPDDRVLVHTVSYPLATYLTRELSKRVSRPIVTYSTARDRDEALERYKRTPGAVLIAPSMDRGIDLPGDLCRVVVIAKIPYPNLGDKRTSARLYGGGKGGKQDGQSWYSVNTVRTLVQMTGRGVRNNEDHATTYILDHSFTTNLWKKNRNLLPGWWCEAVNWRYPVHRLLRAAG